MPGLLITITSFFASVALGLLAFGFEPTEPYVLVDAAFVVSVAVFLVTLVRALGEQVRSSAGHVSADHAASDREPRTAAEFTHAEGKQQAHHAKLGGRRDDS